MTAYYNEFEPYAAQWLRNLITAKLIPDGDVDERSITDVRPADLAGYRQCHFFAGIGGWALAARLAGWPDYRELWTGSPPCQPFSVAGRQAGTADDRHLWPHLFRLASARRPAVLMGEQVAAAVGKDWLDGVFSDLEGIGYACGAAVVPACAVDAPHRRDRLWFVAHADDAGPQGQYRHELRATQGRREPPRLAAASGLLDRAEHAERAVADADRLAGGQVDPHAVRCATGGGAGQVAGLGGAHHGAVADTRYVRLGEPREGQMEQPRGGEALRTSMGHWGRHGWIVGHDGKARRIEPGIPLLAHGVSNRVGRLRAYGNAIVPQVAAEVIGAFMDCRPTPPPPPLIIRSK